MGFPWMENYCGGSSPPAKLKAGTGLDRMPYVDILILDGKWIARDFSGIQIIFDPKTGKVLGRNNWHTRPW